MAYNGFWADFLFNTGVVAAWCVFLWRVLDGPRFSWWGTALLTLVIDAAYLLPVLLLTTAGSALRLLLYPTGALALAFLLFYGKPGRKLLAVAAELTASMLVEMLFSAATMRAADFQMDAHYSVWADPHAVLYGGVFLLFLALVLLVVSMVRKYEQLQLMVALAVLGLSVAALYGCYQSYIGVDIVASQQDMNLNQGMPGRVYSFFDNPNNFAEQLAMLLPLNLALFLNSRWRGKLLSLLSLGVGLVAIGATYGRASWIGLAGAVLVFLALLNWRWVPVFLLVGLAAIPFLPETIYNRILTIFNAGEDSSVQYRFGIYETTRNLMEDYWARGVGLGTDVMKKVFQTYPTNFDGSYPVHTHNNYLQMWGETGILGLLAYLSLLLYQLKSGVKSFCAALDPRVKRMMAAAIGAFCGILVIGVAEYTWYYPRNMFTYWFLFGVIGACIKLVRMEQDKQAA